MLADLSYEAFSIELISSLSVSVANLSAYDADLDGYLIDIRKSIVSASATAVAPYHPYAPFDLDGGYYYGRVDFKW